MIYLYSILIGPCVLLGLGPFEFSISGIFIFFFLLEICRKLKFASAKKILFIYLIISSSIVAFAFQWIFYSIYLLSQNLLLIFPSVIIYILISNLKILGLLFFAIKLNRIFKFSLFYSFPILFFLFDSFTFQIFPWYFGNLIAGNLYLRQVASLTGVFGMSFYSAILGSLVYMIYFQSRLIFRRKKIHFFSSKFSKVFYFYLTLIFVTFSYSIYRVHFFTPLEIRNVKMALIQPSTAKAFQSNKSDEEFAKNSISEVFNLSLKAILETVGELDLLIIPESAVPFHGTKIPKETEAKSVYSKSFHGVVAYLSRIGKVTIAYNEIHFKNGKDQNLFTSLLPTSTETHSSSKQILLPFGEYLPFEKEFPWIRKIFPEAGNYQIENQLSLLPYNLKKDYSYNPKKNFSVESIQMINSPELILKNLTNENAMERRNFLGLICYEAMYTNLVWDFFQQHKDIDFIINSTNDSWFGNYLENYQHDSVVKLRGVEFGRYFIRATLNGVTTSYNHLGEEIIPPSIIDTKTFRLVDAKVLQESTFYARFGSILVWVMSFLLLVLQYSTSRGSRRL